jgi:hypothetical protein
LQLEALGRRRSEGQDDRTFIAFEEFDFKVKKNAERIHVSRT